ncbi:MAG: hypothetical protein H0T46_36745 [Deltaproteobacteria bacterium]|nr:hypothetical protein [Deltaproteobacteria bacterium]
MSTAGERCGSGTSLVGTECVATSASYAIRVPRMIRADGRTPVAVRVFGIDAAERSTRERMVVTVSRPSAGDVVSTDLILDDIGAGTNFIPCQGQLASCLGTASLSMARAADPATPVATAEIELVAPPQIGSLTQCFGVGNILYLDGQNFFYNGPTSFTTQAVFDVFGGPDRAVLHVVVPNGPAFSMELSSRSLGIPLIPSVYERGVRLDMTVPGQPAFDLVGNGDVPTSCAAIGDFQVHQISTVAAPGDDVTQITASFTQYCEFDPTRRVTGCVHYSD